MASVKQAHQQSNDPAYFLNAWQQPVGQSVDQPESPLSQAMRGVASPTVAVSQIAPPPRQSTSRMSTQLLPHVLPQQVAAAPSPLITGSLQRRRASVDTKLDILSGQVSSILGLLQQQQSKENPELLSPSSVQPAAPSIELNMSGFPTLSTDQSALGGILKASRTVRNGDQDTYEGSLPTTVLAAMGRPRWQASLGASPLLTNVTQAGLLTREETLKLLDIFRDRYGRWISFPDHFSVEQILGQIESRCPLLLTVVCALALKYGDPVLKNRCYLPLLRTLAQDVQTSLIDPPLCLEYLQSLLILSLYSTALSDIPTTTGVVLHLDSWELSAQGITLLLRMNSLGFLSGLYNAAEVQAQFNELTACRLWNALVLVHLAYSLLAGRLAVLSPELLQPKETAKFSLATKFDERLIAEVLIYDANYRYCVLGGSVEAARKSITSWLHRWNYMFGQSLNQFVEIDYHYTEVNILLKRSRFQMDLPQLQFTEEDGSMGTIHSGTFAAIRLHCVSVLELINSVKDDSYFAFLSDQIHTIVIFCCLVLMNLLSFEHAASSMSDAPVSDPLKTAGRKAPAPLILRLIYRLKKVSTSDSDAFYKYSLLLEKCFRARLPMDISAPTTASTISPVSARYSFAGDPDEDQEPDSSTYSLSIA